GKVAPEFLAAVQHELRLPRHPVRLGAAAREHVGRVRAARRAPRRGAAALARRPRHRPPRAARHRRAERPHLGAARAAAPLLPRGGDLRLGGALLHAHLHLALDGGEPALDARRVDQRLHGAVPRLRGRQARHVAAHRGLRDAVAVHRRGGEPRQRAPLRARAVRRHGEHGERHPAHGEVLVPGRRGGVPARRALDGVHHHRVSAGRHGGVRAPAPGAARRRRAVRRGGRGGARDAQDDAAARPGAAAHLARALLHVALLRPRHRAPRLRRHRPALGALRRRDGVGRLRLRLLLDRLLPHRARPPAAGRGHEPQDGARGRARVRRPGAALGVPDPGPLPAHPQHGRRGDRVGVDPLDAVRHPRGRAPGRPHGGVHGGVQLLHRDPRDRRLVRLRPAHPGPVRRGQPAGAALRRDAGRRLPAGGRRLRGAGGRRGGRGARGRGDRGRRGRAAAHARHAAAGAEQRPGGPRV
ncbi:MAG: Predicted maltose transporter MalT, partial [uncultured Gemmatimonadaceae bacterium]